MAENDGWGGRRPPCAGLWETPIVHVNGDLTTCCLDTQILNRLGNLRTNTLNELWNGEEIDRWRLAQIQGDFPASGPYCTACNWRSAGAYPVDKSRRWLEARGLQDQADALPADEE